MPASLSRHCLRLVRQWLSPLPEPLPLQRFRNLAQRLRRVLEIGQNGIDGSSNYAKQTPSSSGSSNRTQGMCRRSLARLADRPGRECPRKADASRLDSPNGIGVRLFQYADPSRASAMPLSSDPGGSHIAIEVVDIDAAAAALTTAGARLCSPANVARTNGFEGLTWLYAVTPWGQTIEIVQLAPEAQSLKP
jgi:catechol 2,3-dioxygenase-like lactoylglutathione lyase family enzyme